MAKRDDGQASKLPRKSRAQETGTASEEESRRQFIRRSAQVAAMSLFGVTALDSVLDRVIGRMADIQATEGLANNTAKHLATNAAWASDVPEKPVLRLRAMDSPSCCY